MPAQSSTSNGGEAPEIDVTQLPGYQSVPEGCPQWRKALIEKKNKQLEEDARKNFAERKAEEDKWRNVPEWKRNLILEREKRKTEDEAPLDQHRRRTDDENVRLQSMPEWKRNILMKKKEVV